MKAPSLPQNGNFRSPIQPLPAGLIKRGISNEHASDENTTFPNTFADNK